MAAGRSRVSQEFVAVEVRGAPPRDAVEVLTDAGTTYAVVPKAGLSPGRLADSMPVLTVPGSDEFELPTGKVTVRWEGDAHVLDGFLAAEEAELIRDYGAGGVVEPKKRVDPFEFAEKIRKIEGVRSATANTVRRAHKR